MPHIAVLGLGRMGEAMAHRLLSSGFEVTVWNRHSDRAFDLVAKGASSTMTPASAAESADIVITMLADAEAVTEAITGGNGAAAAMRPDAVLVQMSTIGPAATRALAERISGSVTLVDAPVKGSVPQVRDGTLTVFLGGSARSIAKVEPVLAALGSTIHCGEVGTASAVKLVANAAMISAVTVLAEVRSLSDRLAIPQPLIDEILPATPLAGALTRSLAPGAEFPVSLAAKDLALALDLTADTAMLRAAYDRLNASTRQDQDLSAIVEETRDQETHHAKNLR